MIKVKKGEKIGKTGSQKGFKMNKDKLQPDWSKQCETCEESPVVPMSGLCGPCHFGTADALMGNWWDEPKDDMREDFDF